LHVLDFVNASDGDYEENGVHNGGTKATMTNEEKMLVVIQPARHFADDREHLCFARLR